METNKITIFVISAAAIAFIVIFIAVYLQRENKIKENKIKELEEDKLKLILDSLNNNKDISQEMKLQIVKLMRQYERIDIKISNELAQALQLFQIGQYENAIEDLVKIIEHLLKTYYLNKEEFRTWVKKEGKNKNANKPMLDDLLTFSLKDNKINEVEHKFFVAIKEIRNKEDHTLDLKLADYLNISGMITAIGAIIKFSEIVYPLN